MCGWSAGTHAAPGDILFTDDFERSSLGADWQVSSSFRVAIGTQTSNSGTRSAYLRHNTSSLTMANPIDASGLVIRLEIWIRRGDDSFSELPDNNEDLVVEYVDNLNIWRELARYPGQGTGGEEIDLVTVLPADAMHSNLRIRFRLLTGSNIDFDYWHIDDVRFVETVDLLQGDTQCDTFENGIPYIEAGTGIVAISPFVSSSPPNSMTLNGGPVTATGPVIDSSTNFLGVTLWVRRGSDAFSEDPDPGEDLVVEYLDVFGNWIPLETFSGSGTDGEIFTRSYDLSNTTAAHHSGFRLRLRMLAGSGAAWDFWHIDDICYVSQPSVAATALEISHDGSGQYCVEEQISVRALDINGDTQTSYVGNIDLSAAPAEGSWRLISGAGSLNDANSTDGFASYTFDTADAGQVLLGFTYGTGASPVNMSAVDTSSGVTDDGSQGGLIYQPAAFVMTASAVPDPQPATINDPLSVQIAALDFPVHLTALAGGTCGVVEGLDGPRTVELLHDWVNPGTGGMVTLANGAAMGTSSSPASQTLVFANGRAQFTANYPDAGTILLTARDVVSDRSANSGNFVVRPADLVITSIETLTATPNPEPVDLDGDAFVSAGTPFRVIVEAHNANGQVTPNFGLESPAEGVAVNSAQLTAPTGGINGSANDGTLINASAFNLLSPGTFVNSSLVFDEVGIIRLAARIADGNYQGAGDVNGTLSNPVGRYTVDHFAMTSAGITPACNTFSYMDQPFQVSSRVEARSAMNAPLHNYDQALLSGRVADVLAAAEHADDGNALSARLNLSGSTWVNGTYDLDDPDATFARAITPDGAFDALVLGLSVDDTRDSRPLRDLDLNPTTSGDCIAAANCTSRSLGSTEIYYGRMLVLPRQGPVDAALFMPLRAQRWSNGAFVEHSPDVCSQYTAADMTLHTFTDNLNSGETSVTAPASPVTLTAGRESNPAPTLSAPGPGNEGTALMRFDVPTWLRFNWNGAGDENPSGLATFGRYRGHDRVIIWRESTR